ncbi:MAG: AAA family ATPase [Phycisphaeraceae bacterium]|nr:AAA family ATPase [Phycisphaeraceae bacterium]
MNGPTRNVLDALRRHGFEPRQSGAGWLCRCPAHDDSAPSFSIGDGDNGGAVVNCFAGCDARAVVEAVGLTLADLMPPREVNTRRRGPPTKQTGARRTPRPPSGARGSEVEGGPWFENWRAALAALERQHGASSAHWLYTDSAGSAVGLVVRWDTSDGRKRILPASRTGSKWRLKGMPSPRPLFHLQRLVALPPGARVYVVEGEKAADAASTIGLVATTSAHGSQSAHLADWSCLRDKEVVVLPDNDAAGERYAGAVVALAFRAGVETVRTVRLPGLAAGGDIADYVDAGRTAGKDGDRMREELEALVDNTEVEQANAGGMDCAPTPVSARCLLADHPDLRTPTIVGLLREGETMNVIAPQKTGKSWLATDLALCVAAGRAWLGNFATTQGHVLLIDNELHNETIADRIPRVAHARGIELSAVVDAVHVHSLRGRLVDLHGLVPFLYSLRPGQFRVIVLDAFYRFLPPDTDENDNGSMARLYNDLDAAAAALGCSFVPIHHTTKGGQAGKSVTDVGAGAGAQSRAADSHLILRPHRQRNVVVLEAAARSWPPVEARCLRWSYPVWNPEPDLDPRELHGGRKQKETAPAKQAHERLTPADFAERFVTDVPGPLDVVIGKARDDGLSKAGAKELLARAEHDGLVHRWAGPGREAARFARQAQPPPQPPEEVREQY